MKQTFYLYGWDDGDTLLASKARGFIDIAGGMSLLGTVELDVQPVKKEVEKTCKVFTGDNTSAGRCVYAYIPSDAYNAEVHYKVKQ